MMGVAVDPNFNKNHASICKLPHLTNIMAAVVKTNFDKCDGNMVMRLTLSKDMKTTDRTISLKIFSISLSSPDHPLVDELLTTETDHVSVLKVTYGQPQAIVIKERSTITSTWW